MKHYRQILLPILLTASLLTAPLAFAQPGVPNVGGVDLVEVLSQWFSDITSAIASATGYVDPNGVDGNDDLNNSDESNDDDDSGLQNTGEDVPQNDAGGFLDPNG